MITATIIETEKQLIYEIHSISKAVHYTITLFRQEYFQILFEAIVGANCIQQISHTT